MKNLWIKSSAGFSMTELMVVIIIIGILAAIAIPRYNVFVARSRQGEAQANLGQIYKLQESYKLRHGDYDDAATPAMNSTSAATGYVTESSATNTCIANSLGFTISNCDEARYRYWIAGADENEFVAIAQAFSDNTANNARRTEMRIFPNCHGAGSGRSVTDGNLSTGQGAWSSPANAAGTQTQLTLVANSVSKGDAWYIDEARNLVNYRDIVDYCN